MVKSGKLPNPPFPPAGTRHLFFLLLFCLLALPTRAQLKPQFDVFIGYGDLGGGGIVPEASWFPMVCEVKNDGPPFEGTIEVSAGFYDQNLVRRFRVELPTGTLKRISIPVFSSRSQGGWDVTLFDEHGRRREERNGTSGASTLKFAPAGTMVMGALPRTLAGAPSIRPIMSRDQGLQPLVARYPSAAILPDNPLLWEGMDTFYLNSEKAPDLGVAQVNALLAWLNAGGHLIVAVEAAGDVNATPWLRSLVPCDLTGTRAVADHPQLQQWLRGSFPSSAGSSAARPRNVNRSPDLAPFFGLAPDPDFEHEELQVATGAVHGGQALVSAGDAPLILTANQGRGRVTVLLFSPERKPFNVWKNAPSFWAKLAGVAPELYSSENMFPRGYTSVDGVFGAMIDSKQIRKLPVEWLLLLLILYLAVIGPLDQYWLKRLKRPMLTWLTFPCYVVLFSLLIYFIGYKLRAGETEWNELHFVDVLTHGQGAELRGRTYASIYSPVNGNYRVESGQHFATFRGEFQDLGGADSERGEVNQSGDNFAARIFVPVWTSQLYMSDWWQSADLPLTFTAATDAGGWDVTVNNQRNHPLSLLRVVVGGRIYDLAEVPAGQSKSFKLARGQGTAIGDFVRTHGAGFRDASQQRRRAFGSYGGGRIDDLPDSSMALSFVSALDQNFVASPGLDLSALAAQDQAVLLAWEPGYSPIKPLNQFPTRRSHEDTLWRVAASVNAATVP
jgi:hypothetical protein